MNKKIIITSCFSCIFNKYKPEIEEHICTQLKHCPPGGGTYSMTFDMLTYPKNSIPGQRIANECPLKDDINN